MAEVRAMLQTPLQCPLVNHGKPVVFIRAVEQQSGPDYNSEKVQPRLLLPDFPLPNNLKILDIYQKSKLQLKNLTATLQGRGPYHLGQGPSVTGPMFMHINLPGACG